MYRQWLWFEHQRLHEVEAWPDSPRKHATCAAIQSTLATMQHQHPDFEQPECDICFARRATVLLMAPRQAPSAMRYNIAA